MTKILSYFSFVLIVKHVPNIEKVQNSTIKRYPNINIRNVYIDIRKEVLYYITRIVAACKYCLTDVSTIVDEYPTLKGESQSEDIRSKEFTASC